MPQVAIENPVINSPYAGPARHFEFDDEGITIPYTIEGEERQYYPDFIARLDDGRGREDLLNLIVEVTDEKKKDKAAKVGTARTLWVPAVNNHGAFGRWAFIEIDDPREGQNAIRTSLRDPRAKEKP
jgi:type III restriction enzyme